MNISDIKTYDELQSLIETTPSLFFDNLSEFSSKLPLYMIFVKFPNDVILQYVNKGLNPLDLLTTQNLSGYMQYYVRSLYYGTERVDGLYSDIDALTQNAEILVKRKSVHFDDIEYESNMITCESFNFMW